ncbi:MAG: protein kinase [Flavobacteriaceae bacterium]|nr:protein kinase [Flavobacteriaceae bacterium]
MTRATRFPSPGRPPACENRADARHADPRYRVIRLLGKGGDGRGLPRRARLAGPSTTPSRSSAPTSTRKSKFASRLRREARAANRVHHPNIVRVFDFGQLPDGRYFWPWSRQTVLASTPWSRAAGGWQGPRVLRLWRRLRRRRRLRPRAGVVHRDLKPANLMVVAHRAQPDFLKILDFGVAKNHRPRLRGDGDAHRQGRAARTPAYMTPEQFRGVVPDPRWDIYWIGCIAYELLIGKPPFGGPLPEVVRCHLSVPPPDPSARRPEDPRRGPRSRPPLPPRRTRPAAPTAARSPPESTACSRRGASASRPSTATSSTSRPPRAPIVPADEGEVRKSIVRHHPALGARGDHQLGTRDTRFVVGLARIRQLEDELTRCAAQDAALCVQGDAVEQAARERVDFAALRARQARVPTSSARSRDAAVYADLGERIAALERRLGEVEGERARDLTVIDDRRSPSPRRAPTPRRRSRPPGTRSPGSKTKNPPLRRRLDSRRLRPPISLVGRR